jgi:hypothetical protein
MNDPIGCLRLEAYAERRIARDTASISFILTDDPLAVHLPCGAAGTPLLLRSRDEGIPQMWRDDDCDSSSPIRETFLSCESFHLPDAIERLAKLLLLLMDRFHL